MAAVLADLHQFDPATASWTDLSALPDPPPPRRSHAFASAGGVLYVHGGERQLEVSWYSIVAMKRAPSPRCDLYRTLIIGV